MLKTGLPLSYFDGLPITEIGDIVGYKSGESKANAKRRKDADKGL